MKNDKKNKMFSNRVSESLITAFKKACKKKGVSASVAIRDFMKSFVEANKMVYAQ